MSDVELFSWFFVYKEWGRLRRLPIPDKGFEESFREYIYNKLNFDKMSHIRDMGFGLSYPSFSDTPHEIDIICSKDKEIYVFETKHYTTGNITKDIVFTFLGKVLDYYLKNAEVLSDYNITLLIVTINKTIDDPIRKLCLAYGIKLIEPSMMTPSVIDYFARDFYEKVRDDNTEFLLKIEEVINGIAEMIEKYNYNFTEIFKYINQRIEIELPSFSINPTIILDNLKLYKTMLITARDEWKIGKN